jgi:hypothetical protein
MEHDPEATMIRYLACVLLLTASSGAILWSAAKQTAAGVPRDPSALGYLDLAKQHPDGLDGPE